MVTAASEERLGSGDDSAHPAPVQRGDWRRAAAPTLVEFVAAYALLTGIWVGLGLLITGPLTGVVEVDRDVAEWMVEQRTPALNDWSHVGSMLADTLVKIIATAVIAGIMLLLWRRWRDPVMISAALVLEASVFITVTWIVGRPRPDVEALDASPVSSSFPSGHAAAAAAYGAIAVVVFQRVRNVWVRAVVVVLVVAVPIIVGLSRMYRGMHFLSDTVAGVVLGVASVVAVYLVLRRFDERREKAVPTGP